MKKLLLSITAIVAGFAAYSQAVVAGVSPAAIQGNYDYGNQANCGLWPGETDDGTWGVWSGGLDFNNPGDFIMDTLMLVEDGTPGTNPQGNPISQEGCNPLINNLSGKIAVIYRNTCEFGTKCLNAQNAGAVAVIIVNREPGVIGMLGGTDGVNVTIPAVFIDNSDGQAIIQEMSNGPVVMFIGNKMGASANDLGAVKGEFMVNPYGGAHNAFYDGFTPGIQIYNYGTNSADAVVTATIDGPGGNVYTDAVGPITMAPGDTLPIFAGNTDEFVPFALGVGNYTDGDYTLTYDIVINGGTPDDFAFDNNYTADFKIQGDVIASSRVDAANMPISSSYPSNSTTEYQSCMMVQESGFTGGEAATGMYFVPHTDTSVNQLAGAEIFANAYQWDDGWVDLNDPNYTFDPATNDAYQNLNLITFKDYYPAANSEVDQVAYAEFSTPFFLNAGTRYLFCLQTFESATISFGYDPLIDYGANYSILAQPISPVHVDGMWYTAGWSGVSAPSIAINTSLIGLEETAMLVGSAFPNPATDVVTVQVEANGNAVLTVTDVAGKLAMSGDIALVNGKASVNVADLEAGVYVFNITMENGQSSVFNVVKK